MLKLSEPMARSVRVRDLVFIGSRGWVQYRVTSKLIQATSVRCVQRFKSTCVRDGNGLVGAVELECRPKTFRANLGAALPLP